MTHLNNNNGIFTVHSKVSVINSLNFYFYPNYLTSAQIKKYINFNRPFLTFYTILMIKNNKKAFLYIFLLC